MRKKPFRLAITLNCTQMNHPDSNLIVYLLSASSQLFVEKHNNVTILFADIVNFTPLTVKLSAEDLVETLNQLFGSFDNAATVSGFFIWY